MPEIPFAVLCKLVTTRLFHNNIKLAPLYWDFLYQFYTTCKSNKSISGHKKSNISDTLLSVWTQTVPIFDVNIHKHLNKYLK